jgi:prophage regulatory protein
MPLRKIIRLPTVLDHTGLTRSTLYRKIAQGTFPKQVDISINGAGWYEADVARWIADPAAWRADNDNDELRGQGGQP